MAITVEQPVVASPRDVCANKQCGHVRALHGTDACRINSCRCQGFNDGTSEEARKFSCMPMLGFSPALEDDGRTGVHRLVIGTDALTLDGAPFPWSTVGDWTVKFTDDGIATLNVSIAVTLPSDPAAYSAPDGD